MAIAQLDYEKLFIWKYGMPPYEFWLDNKALIQNIVKEYKLKPVDRRYFPTEMPVNLQVEVRETKARKQWEDKRLWPGGIRIAHVHLNGEIYMFEKEHWNKLVTAKVNEFKEKLANVQTVNFEQMMKLSEGFDAIV
jgi:hypothetical protein